MTLHLTVPLNTSGPAKPTELFITEHHWGAVKNLLWAIFFFPQTASQTYLVNISVAEEGVSTLHYWASYYRHSVLIIINYLAPRMLEMD